MYNGITSKGSQYLAKCQAEGLPIKLSKVKIGNGTIQDLENPYNFTDVKSIKQEFEISEKSQVEEQLKIKVQIDNTSLEEGYFTKEIGIYADDNGQEILYWYINDGDQASWLPPASVSPVKFKYTFNIQVTTTETVIVNFTGKELWVDREFLNTELVKKLDKGTVPNSLNTAEKIVAALQGNGGLKFDENLLYLNDKGTKKKGVYYLDRLAEGIFECLEQTEETVNNSAKFKNISNKENSDRLDNLITFTKDNNKNCLKYSNGLMIQYGQITDYTPEMGSILTIPFLEPFKSTAFWAASALNAAKAYPSRILEYKSIEISFNGGSSYISWLVFGTWK